ncbi:hypothetical protein GCM10028805_47240 [Spirosoma harenae]
MKKPRGIIYSTPMVLANLAGIKSQTRRIAGEKLKRINENLSYNWTITKDVVQSRQPKLFDLVDTPAWRFQCPGIYDIVLTCPYGQPGDILYGRERLYLNEQTNEWHYFADKTPVLVDPANELDAVSWAHHKETDYCTSIHMPRFSARIWHQITNVRLERLQDITEDDASAEGLRSCLARTLDDNVVVRYQNYLDRNDFDHPNHKWCRSAKSSYLSLWDKLHGTGASAINPYLWVIEYKPIAKKEVPGV